MIRTLTVVFGIILLFAGQSYPQGVVYFSENETDLNGNRVPFYPGGTIIGDIRSNDAFTFAKPVPVISGKVYTGGDLCFEDSLTVEDLHLPTAPQFSSSIITSLSKVSRNIRNNAQFIPTDDGKLMVRLILKGDQGCEVWKWPCGTDPDQNAKLDQTIGGLAYSAIFVDGECEVEGTLNGNLTIGTADNLYIRDDIVYLGARPGTGDFGNTREQQGAMKHSLGLVSEKNIVIANTVKNGRGNGVNLYPNDYKKHSIAINASLWAVGGSLMFEQTNDSTELYQGPSPDERGTVYITGQVMQKNASPLYNSNHGGTGYKMQLTNDFRFWNHPAPYIYNSDFPVVLGGYYDDRHGIGYYNGGSMPLVYVGSHCNIGDIVLNCDTLTFNGPYTLEIRSHGYFVGSTRRYKADSTIYIHYPLWKPGVPKAKIICWNAGAEIEFHNVTIGPGVELYITAMEPRFTNSEAKDNATFICQNINLDGCKFTNLNLNCWEDAVVQRNLIRGTLTVDNLPDNCFIRNNTILSGGGDGVVVKSYKKIDIRNNIITGAKRGLVDSYKRKGITVGYNCLWDCKETDVGISDMGAGNVYADPRFYDARNAIYELAVGSSCYNAGDPSSPKDPDGTRADIGAYYCAQTSVEDEPVARLVPSETGVTVSPNPFNSTTRIRFSVSTPGYGTVEVYDIQGREVAVLLNGLLSAGSREIQWNGTHKNGNPVVSGEYLVRVATADGSSVHKVVVIR